MCIKLNALIILKLTLNLVIVIVFVILLSHNALAGVIIGGTRVVVNEKNNSATFSVRNKDKIPYLVSTKIGFATPWDSSQEIEKQQVPFITTPPLFVLGEGKENTIRVIYTGGNLPSDRESLFQLEIASIPSGKSKDNELQVAVRTRLKLIWRPKALEDDSGQAYTKLHWNKRGVETEVTNPTPYVVTIFNLKVNGSASINSGVVMPFTTKIIHLCPERGTCKLEYQSISDYGRIMPAHQYFVLPHR
ncbi:molecular chaperone [Enterobacter ludwigii]|uniref:fimbrial biogenesis chaperone n=1 Tax=Enterobacter ludwigii TaxID=299767 RepID=UPI00159BF297|nr:molecular chaperone [Enterobacter ludwigii]QLA06300.1 molecular chaperone [Enterobacter ludwigii]